MDDGRFDALVRSLAAPTTRRIFLRGAPALGLGGLSALVPGASASAKHNKCAIGTTRCGRKCVDLAADPKHCGKCKHRCAPGQPCAAGTCGPNLGACQAGDDICKGVIGCNGNVMCECMHRFADGELVCGDIVGCERCRADSDCATTFGAGAFCARKTGLECCTNRALHEGFCAVPCSS